MPNPPAQRLRPGDMEWPFYEPLPFEPVVLRDLIIAIGEANLLEFTNGRLRSVCDHTMNRSRAFLEGRGDVDAMIQWLGMHGAGCDCEVLLNVAGKYEEAFGPID